MIKAEEARRIANGNSVEIRQRLEAIGKMVERAAREGRHQVDIQSDPGQISPIMEQLTVLGYYVTSFSLKELSLKIKW